MPRTMPDAEPFTRITPGSQTLLRGLDLLRAFLGGASMLSNAQLAERSGLPRPTVSRLTHSLVSAGYLEYDSESRGYRLAPVCLSLARSFRIGRSELEVVLPLLRKVATEERVNVALAAPDGTSMIYLETIREGRGPMRRTAMAGSRFPMEDSSIGQAYLAALSGASRKAQLAALAAHSGAGWPEHKARIAAALAHHAKHGYCRSQTVIGAAGIATAVAGPYGAIYSVSISFSAADDNYEPLVARFAPMLLALAEAMRAAWAEFDVT